MRTAIIAVSLIGYTALALSAPPVYYDRREEGWFWYELPPLVPEVLEDEEEPEPASLVIQAPPAEELPESAAAVEPEGPAPMSVPWLQEKIPEIIELAIDDPGEDLVNVRAFAYLQRVSFDKARRFAENMQRVTYTDPLLDMNNRFPISTVGERALYHITEAEERLRMDWLNERVGFFYIHDQTCHYCREQLPILESLKRNRGFEVVGISVDGSPLPSETIPSRPDLGHADRFQVQTVPAIVMVWPPDNAAVLSQSILAQPQIIRRAIVVAQANDLLTEEVDQSLGVRPQPPRLGVDPTEGGIDNDDPATWVEYIRKQAGHDYDYDT